MIVLYEVGGDVNSNDFISNKNDVVLEIKCNCLCSLIRKVWIKHNHTAKTVVLCKVY